VRAGLTMLRVGEAAPLLDAQPVSGLRVRVGSGAPLVVCFVRSVLGGQARAAVRAAHADLPALEARGIGVVLVTRGPMEAARDFVPRWHVRVPVVVDEDGAMFRAWGVGAASWTQTLRGVGGPVLRDQFRAAFEGRGGLRDPLQLPATFFVDAGGVVRFAEVGPWPWSLPAMGRAAG
jgi:peroxiredoxin